MKRKILLPIISGATATGKTAVAVALCERVRGEVVSADSMQIFRGMEILSAAPTQSETRGICHHLIGMVDPSEAFSAATYRDWATIAIGEIAARGNMPVMCGGTGLYIDAVTRQMSFSDKGSEAIRNELHQIADCPGGRDKLHKMLSEVDPESAARLHKNDVRRVIRAIEVYRLTGITLTLQTMLDAERGGDYDELLFALEWSREALYKRIDARVDAMIAKGLVDEVRALVAANTAHPTSIQAIGYKEIAAALSGDIPMAEAISAIKRATRNYAKRQETWLRRDKRTIWICAENREAESVAGEIYEKIEAHVSER